MVQQQSAGRPGIEDMQSQASARDAQWAAQLHQMKADLAAAQQRLHDSGELLQDNLVRPQSNYTNSCVTSIDLGLLNL